MSITEGEDEINSEVAAITTADQNNTTLELEGVFDISVNPMMLRSEPNKAIKSIINSFKTIKKHKCMFKCVYLKVYYRI